MMLRIATTNVRGLSNNYKRRKLFHYFHNKEFHILLLQETHMVKNQMHIYKSQWGGKIYVSNGDSNARAVAIMVKRGVKFKVNKIFKDNAGRIVIVDGEYENRGIKITPIYAPNVDDPAFMRSCTDLIDSIETQTLIIGGDFNFVMDLNIDKVGGNFTTHHKTVTVFKKYAEAKDLVDVWRTQHPKDKNYTWYCKKPYMAKRLDYLFCTTDIMTLVKSDIHPKFSTDHCPVSMTIKLNAIERGCGFWKLNTSALSDNNYVQDMNNSIEDTKSQQFRDARTKWDFLKLQATQVSLDFLALKKCSQNNKMQVFERKLQRLNKELHEINDQEIGIFGKENIQNEIEKIEGELNNILEEKTRGAIIRSQYDWFMYGEKPSSYFFQLEKYNYIKKNRYRLMKEDSTEITDPKQILEEQTSFYEKLYSNQDIHLTGAKDHLEELKSPKLSEFERDKLNREIELQEIITTIKQMENGKVPGTDGLPIEWYKMFFSKFSKLFHDVIKDISQEGYTLDQGRGIISLMEKPGKNMLFLNQWRPLSLLNVDAKIHSKILANRMYEVLPKIIHQDQSAFIKGRNISDNLLDLASILEYCDEKNMQSLLVSIDFMKAFDTASWKAFYETLRFFNFGENYIQMVEKLFLNTHSCTINNGTSSRWFKLERGFRQGDCYSPPAFITLIEILGLKIRQDDKIVGVKFGHVQKKHAQFAEDLWASLAAEQDSLDALLETIENYGNFSGLRINYDKTVIMRIGSLKDSDAKLYTQRIITWSHKVKILGIVFTANVQQTVNMNYDKIMHKINSIIQSWHSRGLTLLGKTLIVNTLIASQLVYLFLNTYCPKKEKVVEIEKEVKKFLWDQKRPLFKQELLQQDYSKGGIRLINMQSKHDSLKCKFAVQALGKNSTWVIKAQETLPLPLMDILQCNTDQTDILEFTDKQGRTIWQDIWVAWSQINFRSVDEINNYEQVIEQSLWFNSHIVYYEDYHKKGIMYVKDMLNDQGKILSWRKFQTNFDIHTGFLNFFAIISAVPAVWKKCCENKNINGNEFNPLEFLNAKRKQFANIAYWKLVNSIKTHDPGIIFWSQKIGTLTSEEWARLRIKVFKITPLTKLRYFQYRLLAGRLTTNSQRNKWDKSVSPFCTFCNAKENATIMHLLWDCITTKHIWKALTKYISNASQEQVKFTVQETLFSMYAGKHHEVINTMILIGKQYLYAKHCMNERPTFLGLLMKIKDYKDLEYLTHLKLNTSPKYYKKWKWVH